MPSSTHGMREGETTSFHQCKTIYIYFYNNAITWRTTEEWRWKKVWKKDCVNKRKIRRRKFRDICKLVFQNLRCHRNKRDMEVMREVWRCTELGSCLIKSEHITELLRRRSNAWKFKNICGHKAKFKNVIIKEIKEGKVSDRVKRAMQ